ncbi:MAG: DUF177 domain-containing protein [Coriobacteriia bacterium]|nr:DUF177 domain-containing protein [Coriobacteriia bacterium]
MTTETYPVDLGALLDELGAERVIEDEVELAEFTVGDVTFVPEGPAAFGVSLTNTGAGVVGDGWVREAVRTECSRCLVPCSLELAGTFEAFYVRPGQEEGIPEEQEYEVIREGRVDLGPALRAALAIEAPFAPLHDPECAGICPTCGADRNVETCSCPEEARPDNPFAVLQRILPERQGAGAGGGGQGGTDEPHGD